MTNDSPELPLFGGRTQPGVVRVGTTVRRPLTERSGYVTAVLRRLELAGFHGAPRFLGIDEQGRQILSYLDGETGHQLGRPSPGQLVALARWLARFHDALAGSPEAAGDQTVCHNDLAPWNLILTDGVPSAFVDFDDAAPGRRSDDVAYLLWTFLELGAAGVSAEEQSRQLRLFCDAYAVASAAGDRDAEPAPEVLGALRRQQGRILELRIKQADEAPDSETRDFAATRVKSVRSELAWAARHADTLGAALDR